MVDGDERVWASVLVQPIGSAVVLLNRRIAGGPSEHACLDWALALVAEGACGFFVLAAQIGELGSAAWG